MRLLGSEIAVYGIDIGCKKGLDETLEIQCICFILAVVEGLEQSLTALRRTFHDLKEPSNPAPLVLMKNQSNSLGRICTRRTLLYSTDRT